MKVLYNILAAMCALFMFAFILCLAEAVNPGSYWNNPRAIFCAVSGILVDMGFIFYFTMKGDGYEY